MVSSSARAAAVSLRRGKTAVGSGEEQVADDVADVVAHGAVEGELRVDDLYALFVGKIERCGGPVDQGLGRCS